MRHILQEIFIMQNDFNFCPECGGKNIQNVNNRKWLCPDCGFELYNNVATAVGLVIKDSEGKILFEKRAKEPRKGFLAFPGGFSEPDETAEKICERECFEEIGVKPEKLKFIASYPNTYEFKKLVYKTCDLFFEAVLPKNAKLKAQESEVQGFEWRFARTKEEIENLPLAFVSAKNVLNKLIELKP